MAYSKVLCYGGIALESFIELPYQPKPGIAHIICDQTHRLGGGAAHVAEWLGSWNIPTRLCGYVIGFDWGGDQLLDWLGRFPTIDLSYVERRKEIKTLESLTIPFNEGNKYLLCIGYANVTLTPPGPAMLKDVQILEIAYYYRQERGNAAADEMVRLAAARGIKIVAMDLLDLHHETVPAAEIIINSAASIRERYPNVDLHEHSYELHAANKGIVITTDGDREIHAIDKDGTQYSVLPPKVSPIETTGAGDSFRAGIIYGILQRWPLIRSLKWAAAVSAYQVQRSLSQDTPPPKEKIAVLVEQVEVI
jgi:sugar/nucleoside kinase (ribokinase family)